MEGLNSLLSMMHEVIRAFEEADFDYLDFLVAHAKQELGEFEEKHGLKGLVAHAISTNERSARKLT